MIMAKDEKNGGFFSKFKKSEASSEATPSTAPSRGVASTPESRNSVVSGALSKTAAAPEPVEDSSLSEPLIDTVEAFNVYCRSLVEIGTSQLMVVDQVLGMLSNSLNKIIDGSGTKE